MKILNKIVAISALLVLCGCASTTGRCSDGTVAPDSQSHEKSEVGDPQLPFMIPWWKFQ